MDSFYIVFILLFIKPSYNQLNIIEFKNILFKKVTK